MLRSVTEIAFAKLASFMGPSLDMSTLFAPDIKVGAVSAASVAVTASAPHSTLVPYEYSVLQAAKATRHLRQEMLSSPAAMAIQAQVSDMQVICPASIDVKATLLSFADRVIDPPLQDISCSVQLVGCQEFSDGYYSTIPFDESCVPPVMSWYPLLPEQHLPTGFNPQFKSDLYHNLPVIRQGNVIWFSKELQNLDNMEEHPEALKRLHRDCRVISESQQVTPVHVLIFDIDASRRVTLTRFHAPIESQFNRLFITHIAGLPHLPLNPGAPLVAPNPTYHDLEMLSNVLLGCQRKAPVHNVMHSMYNRNMLSLAKNITGIKKQAVQKQQCGIAQVHQHMTYSPARYVSCGSVKRKENLGNPHNTDNHSDPLERSMDANGVNGAGISQQCQSQSFLHSSSGHTGWLFTT